MSQIMIFFTLKTYNRIIIFYKEVRFYNSLDIDLINYSSSNFIFEDFSSFDDNQEIDNLYKTMAVNYRFGVEGRYDKLYLRLGYSYLTDPNKNLVDVDNKKVRRSIGLGFLSNTISLDFTYLSTKDYSRLIPYPIYSNHQYDISSLKNTF